MSETNLKEIAVVIPVYKRSFDQIEERNVTHNLRLLGKLPVFWVTKETLDVSYYRKRYPGLPFVRYPDRFFDGLKGYNKLMLSEQFYMKFQEYRFIFICQPDVLLLKGGEALEPFLTMPYDYIGAPWLPKDHITVLPDRNKIQKLINLFLPKYDVEVGNGGLSLRRTERTLSLLRKWRRFVRIWPHYEDYFFAYMGRYRDLNYRIAPVETAMQFSLESRSRELIESGAASPVGVHAYQKYYPDLWDEIKGEMK